MKLFQREQRSLFGEILDWMLTPLLLLWPVSLALTWLVAQSIAGKPFDRALEYNVQALAQLVTVQNQRATFNLPQPAREILRADDSDQVYYQVLGPRGELLSGERDFPLPPTTSGRRPAKRGCATTRCAASTCASPTPGSAGPARRARRRWCRWRRRARSAPCWPPRSSRA
jgi:two-component system sensor histidine kinase TctE